MFLLGGTLGERGDALKNPSWFKTGVQAAKAVRKPMRTATNWNQKKVKLTRAREGYGLRGYIVKKYIYLPDFLDESGKPFDIYRSAYCASYYTVILAGPAYYFFNSRAGSPREVDWNNPKYPGLFRVDRSLSGERGETFRSLREVEGTTATGESYSFTRAMAEAGFGGMNTPLYMEVDPMLYKQQGTESIEYLGSGKKGFNEQALDLVKKSLITQYSAYYNAVKGDVSKAFGEEVELERFLPIYPQLTYDVGEVKETVSPLNPRVHVGTLTRALMIVEYFAEGRFLSTEQRDALGKAKTAGQKKVQAKEKSDLTTHEKLLLSAIENNRTIPVLWEWTSEDRKLLKDLLPYLRREGITIHIPTADSSSDSELYKMQKARIPNVIAKGKTTTYSSLSANTSLKQRIQGLQSRGGGADLLKDIADFFKQLRTQNAFRKALIGEMSGRDLRKLDSKAERQTAFALISAFEEAVVKVTPKQDLIDNESDRVYNYYYHSFRDGKYRLTQESAQVKVADNTISRDEYDNYVTMQAIEEFLQSSTLTQEWKYMAVYWYMKCKSWNLSPKFLDILWRSSSYGIEWYVVARTAVLESLQKLGGGKQLDTRSAKKLLSLADQRLQDLLGYISTPGDIAKIKTELRAIQEKILKIEAQIPRSVDAGAKEYSKLEDLKEKRSDYRSVLQRYKVELTQIEELKDKIKGYKNKLGGEITLGPQEYQTYDAVTIVLNLKITQTEKFNRYSFSKEEQEAQAANALGVRLGKVARSFIDTFLPRTDNNSIVDYMKAYLRWDSLQGVKYTEKDGKVKIKLTGKNQFFLKAEIALQSLRGETGIMPNIGNWIPRPSSLPSFVIDNAQYFEGLSLSGKLKQSVDEDDPEKAWKRSIGQTVGAKLEGLEGFQGRYTIEESALALSETSAFFFDGPIIYSTMNRYEKINSAVDLPKESQQQYLNEWYQSRDRGDNNPNLDLRLLAESSDIFTPNVTQDMIKTYAKKFRSRTSRCNDKQIVNLFVKGKKSIVGILVECGLTTFDPIADYKWVKSNLKEESLPQSSITIDNVSDVFSTFIAHVKKHPKAEPIVNKLFWSYVNSFDRELQDVGIKEIKRWASFKSKAKTIFPPIDKVSEEEGSKYIKDYLNQTLPLTNLVKTQGSTQALANTYIERAAPFIGKCLSYWGPLSEEPSFDQAILLHVLYTEDMTAEAVFKLIYRQLDQKTAVCIFPPQESLLPNYKAFVDELAELVQVQENKKKFGVRMLKNCILSGDFKLAQRTVDILDSLNMNQVFCCLTDCDERNTNAVVFMHEGKLLTSYWKGSDKGLEKLTADWYKGKQKLPQAAAPRKLTRDEFSKLSPKEQQKVMFEEEKLRMKMRKGRKSKRTEDEEGILRWGEGWEALR